MTAPLAPLALVRARARHRPGQWMWPLIGLAVAVALAGGVAAEAAVSADQAARSALGDLTPLQRTVRITWQGPLTPAASGEAEGLLRSLGLPPRTRVTLLNPVRLSGVIVRLAAIAPLGRWIPGSASPAFGACRPRSCPMLLAGGGPVPDRLHAAGVAIDVVAKQPLRSEVPLGFQPAGQGQWPLLVTGDVVGLDRLAGLGGVYRTHSWLAVLRTGSLHSWGMAAFERRLARAQAALLDSNPQFSMSAPFDGLDAARSQARAAPTSLLLAGGGALATLVLFVALAAAGLRREQLEDLGRLRANGATVTQLAVFVAGEAAAVCAAGLGLGFVAAVGVATAVAGSAGEPVGTVLSHSLISPSAGLALAGAWLVASGLIAISIQVRTLSAFNLLAAASAAALAAGLAVGGSDTGASAALLAPLCCLAAGVLVFRLATWLLRPAERLARNGPVSLRLAVIGLARAPGLPALAIAFVCVSVGLGGFALAYRATLERGAADQAANRVPLDALIRAGQDFATPLQLAPLSRWRAISRGQVYPVRRTQGSYQAGSSFATVPTLGVPAQALPRLHGWRSSDGSAALATLAQRLAPSGPIRTPGPAVPPGARELSLPIRSPDLAVSVTADLRGADGLVRQLNLGTAAPRRALLRARLPLGRWEVEGLELDEGSGLAATTAHQNGESATPATEFGVRLSLGPLRIEDGAGRLRTVALGSWTGVGAAGAAAPGPSATASRGAIVLSFQANGQPGVLRPRQPGDSTALPVLVDPATASAAAADGHLSLVVDNLAVRARVVGVLRRFPTVPSDSGFIVADQARLAAALEAQLPGQGAPDELWISASRTGALRHALGAARLSGLDSAFRAQIERALRQAPVARAMTRTFLAAAGVSAVLALIGLMLVVQGPFRDRVLEDDLAAQGLGPAAVRGELRSRTAIAGLLGILPGAGVALLLTRLAVSAVGSSGSGAPPVPTLVTVVPGLQLAVWVAGAALVVTASAWFLTRWLVRGAGPGRSRTATPAPIGDDILQEGWAG